MVNVYYSKFDKINFNRLKENMSDSQKIELTEKKSSSSFFQSLVSRFLLSHALSEKGQNPAFSLGFNNFGKPYIINSEYFFNISHSYDCAACAISLFNIGLDVEKIRQIDKRKISILCNRTLSDDEKKVLDENNLAYSFLKIWTIKESYLKLLGIGLKYDLKNFFIDFSKGTVYYRDYDIAYFSLFEIDGFVFCLSSFQKEEYYISEVLI